MKKDNDADKTSASAAKSAPAAPKKRPSRAKGIAVPETSAATPTTEVEKDGDATMTPRPAPLEIAYEPSLPDDPVYTGALAHGRQVERLAAALFRELAPLHRLDGVWEARLCAAARLHARPFARTPLPRRETLGQHLAPKANRHRQRAHIAVQ